MPPKYTTHTQNPVLKTINADTKLFEFPHSTERNLHSQLFGNDAGTATKISCDSSGNLSTSDTNITSGNDDTLANAQQVGLYAHDSSNNWRALQVDSNEALKTTNVHINAGASQSSRSSAQIVQVLAKDDSASTLSTMNLDSSGNLKTADTTQHFLTGLLSTKAQQLDIKNSTANIDAKIAKSPVVSSDGTTSAQIVMACGSNDGTNLRTIATNDTGDVRSLLIGTDSGGNTQEVKTSNNGNLIMEVEHSWDTETLLTSTTLTAGSAITTNALDIGQGISHEYNDITFFVDNSNTSVSISIQPQSSPDGTNWYVSSAGTSVSTTQAKSFICSDNCLNFGRANRYLRLRIVNNDALLSTDVAVQSGRYK